MNRSELEHVTRASAVITADREIVVVGSTSIAFHEAFGYDTTMWRSHGPGQVNEPSEGLLEPFAHEATASVGLQRFRNATIKA